MNATAQATGASIANVNLLRENKVDVIFVQNDVAYYALSGTELLRIRPTRIFGEWPACTTKPSNW